MPREQIVFPRVEIQGDQPGSRATLIDAAEEAGLSVGQAKTLADMYFGKAPTPSRAAPPFPVPHVTWNGTSETGGWVQIMFECDREFLEQLMADLPKDQHIVEIHSEVLNRDAANRLIRAGRRARDHAYGKDE